MIHFAVLAFLIIFLMALYVWLCLQVNSRSLAVGFFMVLTVGAFAASIESTGQPKPIQLEWRSMLDAEIVGLTWNEEQHRVWVWAMQDGAPVAYVFPWPKDQKQMGELQNKWRRRGATGDEFNLSMDGDVAKVKPPTPQPEKTEQ